MRRPRLLDLFCGAGGCAAGYAAAGWLVTGVDHRPMPRFPFEFIQADALEFVREHGAEYDAIHASPPCQRYSSTAALPNVKRERHVDLIAPTRDALAATGRPWVIENVERAPLTGALLCGLSFGLKVFRHRIFESSGLLFEPPHQRHGARRIGVGGFVCVAGNGGGHVVGLAQAPALRASRPSQQGRVVGWPGYRLDDPRRAGAGDPAGLHGVHRPAAAADA